MTNEINPEAAVDLADHMKQLQAIQQITADRERVEIEIKAASWEKNMNRAFKGIMSRPTRHAFLQKAIRDDS